MPPYCVRSPPNRQRRHLQHQLAPTENRRRPIIMRTMQASPGMVKSFRLKTPSNAACHTHPAQHLVSDVSRTRASLVGAPQECKVVSQRTVEHDGERLRPRDRVAASAPAPRRSPMNLRPSHPQLTQHVPQRWACDGTHILAYDESTWPSDTAILPSCLTCDALARNPTCAEWPPCWAKRAHAQALCSLSLS